MSRNEMNAFGATALAMRHVSDEECNKWCLLSIVPSSLDHKIRNNDTVPYIL
jgi:hypothetical protein